MMQLDHVVLWVEDPLRSVAWYAEVLGFEGVRVDEFRAKTVPFPSVRINATTIIDLAPRAIAPAVNAIPGAAGTAGHPTNHVCLAMSAAELDALTEKLRALGTPGGHVQRDATGAQGIAPRAFYFRDPDGNVLEARTYDR
jgi:catechol 2,3-dioxygenase-like lactoylglutathione lyase family enzyme